MKFQYVLVVVVVVLNFLKILKNLKNFEKFRTTLIFVIFEKSFKIFAIFFNYHYTCIKKFLEYKNILAAAQLYWGGIWATPFLHYAVPRPMVLKMKFPMGYIWAAPL